MNKKYQVVFYASIVAALACATCATVFAPDSTFFAPSGVWSVLPPLAAILLAFATKNVVVSLLVGVFTAAYLIALQHAPLSDVLFETFDVATLQMRDAVADPWNAGILLQCGAIGGLVALIAANGGVRAVATLLTKFARGPRSSQIVAWFLGLFIFFDDYANVQIRGPIMRPITDRNRVSREKLSYILDATAAPIAGIALISTWIGTELSYISSGLTDAGLADAVSPYGLFVESIPFRFYNLLTLAFILISALTLRDFGPMLRAERLARKGYLREMDSTLVSVDDAMNGASDGVEVQENKGDESTFKTALFALVPLLVLIFSAVLFFYASGYAKIIEGGDQEKIASIQTLSIASVRDIFSAADASVAIFRAAVLAGIVAFLMGVWSGKNSASEGVRVWMEGVKSLVFTFVILILAWTLSSCIGKDNLGTARFLVGALSEGTPVFLLPTLIFVLAAIVSFATGTSYGTMAIITPLAIPFANALAPGDHSYLVLATGAVLTGAIFGDHSSPISDTTILSATSARCGLLDHVGTQFLYAICVGIVAVVCGFLPAGFGAPLYVTAPLGLVALVLILTIWGKKVPNEIADDEEK